MAKAMKKSSADQSDLDAIVRNLIAQSGKSCYAIANESGVSEAQLSRFVREERSLTLQSASKLAKVLGFTITKT